MLFLSFTGETAKRTTVRLLQRSPHEVGKKQECIYISVLTAQRKLQFRLRRLSCSTWDRNNK